jgi:NADH-quinone oxidoreductase subunit N
MPEIFVYVYLYDILVIGSFAVVYLVERSSDGNTSLDSFDGLSRRRPLPALGFTVLLLAQAGIPFTSGFVAKFAVISAAVSEEFYVLSVIAMVAAVIAAFLYLRIMIRMWLTDASSESKIPIPLATGFVVTLTVLGSLFFGLDPEPLLDAADSVLEFAR